MKVAVLAALMLLILMSWFAALIVPPPAGGKRTTLIWSTDNNPVRQEQADLFNKLNPDLFVVIDPASNESQKVIVQSIGGVGPDLFDSYGSASLQGYVRSGVAMDVTDRLANAGIKVQQMIWPLGISSCVYGGRTYAFPANCVGNAVWYNKRVFDEAGEPYPRAGWTWNDLIGTAKKLTKLDASGKPERFGMYWDFNNTWDLVYQFGGRMFSEDQTRCELDSPEAIQAAQLSHDLVYKYKVAPSTVQEAALSTQGGWGSGGITFLMSGRVAMAFGGRWWLNLMRKDPTLKLGVVEIPYAKKQVLTGASRVTCVNRNGKHLDAAIRFLRFEASREYNELVNDQADAIAAVKKYCYTPRFLFNPKHPEEDYNAAWRAVLGRAVPIEICTYLPGNEMAPVNDQLDLMKNDVKSPAEAFRQAKIGADARIRRNAQLRPFLHDLYVKSTGMQP